MTPTETSATRLEAGRDLDVAVARALGWVNPSVAHGPKYWDHREADGVLYAHLLPIFSTDDATALRHGVPWLRERGYAVTIEYDKDGVRVSAMPEYGDDRPSRYVDVPEAPNALAHALCQVIVLVAGPEGRG